MSKGFDIPHNKHLGNSHDYWKAPQANSKQSCSTFAIATHYLPIPKLEV